MRAPTQQEAREYIASYAIRRRMAADDMRQVTQELAGVIAYGRAAGLSMSEIGRLAGVSRDTLYQHREESTP